MNFIILIFILFIYDQLLFKLFDIYYCKKYKEKQKYGCKNWHCKEYNTCEYSKRSEINDN